MKIRILISLVTCLPLLLSAQNVGVGTNTPQGKLQVTGSADQTQLIIDAYSAQTNLNPLIRLRKSDGTDLLWINSDHISNTFIGFNTGQVNNAASGGVNNTFLGGEAGRSNTTGNRNTASGRQTLYSNTTGSGNSANGHSALYSNTTGQSNTASGDSSLYLNIVGNRNTAYGKFSLLNNLGGSNATAIGYNAMQYAYNLSSPFTNRNVALGFEALRGSVVPSVNTGNYNTALGYWSFH